jgi:monoamine oxidase
MPLTRRSFVQAVAARGGRAYAAMLALDLLGPQRAAAFAPGGHGAGTTVVILGAGVAGLCAAYELGKRGYSCTILEARSRPGGRAWTVRGGTTETEIGGVAQTAAFRPGLWFNPGPSRVPQHHVTIDYYRELGVPMEVFANINENAYVHSTTGRPSRVRLRDATYGLRGHIDELLAKAVATDALDVPLDKDDRDKLLAYLREDGGLTAERVLKAPRDGRLGYLIDPGAGDQPGVERDPLGLAPLIESGFGRAVDFATELDQQPQMFQPVGGIDALPRAFAARLPGKIRYEAAVRAIRKHGAGVRIEYTDRGGAAHALDADFAICTIPLSVLREIPADWSPPMKAAIASVPYADVTKVGLEFKRRFWEEDDRIFGGISWTNQSITQIWYPSWGYLGARGILTGTYNFGKDAVALGKLAPAERIRAALDQGVKIHPQYRDEYVRAFAVAWQNIPHNRGGWGTYTAALRANAYPVLCRPDGPIYLAGEHVSYIPGWQAGALESARLAVTNITARVRAARGGAT